MQAWQIDPNTKFEIIQKSYVEALAADSGITIAKPNPDTGVDFIAKPNRFTESTRQYSPIGPSIDFQLKSTTRWEIKNNYITYKLRSKNYNDMVKRNIDVVDGCPYSPIILIIMCLPRNCMPYILQNTCSLRLSHCCYWYRLNKNITEELSPYSSSKTIYIPVRNIFSAKYLKYIANAAFKGWGEAK